MPRRVPLSAQEASQCEDDEGDEGTGADRTLSPGGPGPSHIHPQPKKTGRDSALGWDARQRSGIRMKDKKPGFWDPS